MDYKKTIEQMIADGVIPQEAVEKYCPKLVESEDDKIRAFLVDFIKVCKWTEKGDQGWPTKDACVAWLEKQGEQKPAEWSEEDETIIDNLVWAIANDRIRPQDRDDYCDWLKDLKDRVQSQNSSVTDEELAQAKKEAYNEALDKIEYHSGEPTFDDGWSAAIWYLKKRNGRPQNTWKPSDEQMEALDGICSYIRNKADWEISQDTIHQLYSLSEQLKKLKG